MAFIADSGTSNHMVGNPEILSNPRDLVDQIEIEVADGGKLKATQIGDIDMEDIKIKNVFVVPGLKAKLISVRQLADSRIFTTFGKNHAEMWKGSEQVGGAIVVDGLYEVRFLDETGNYEMPYNFRAATRGFGFDSLATSVVTADYSAGMSAWSKKIPKMLWEVKGKYSEDSSVVCGHVEDLPQLIDMPDAWAKADGLNFELFKDMMMEEQTELMDNSDEFMDMMYKYNKFIEMMPEEQRMELIYNYYKLVKGKHSEDNSSVNV